MLSLVFGSAPASSNVSCVDRTIDSVALRCHTDRPMAGDRADADLHVGCGCWRMMVHIRTRLLRCGQMSSPTFPGTSIRASSACWRNAQRTQGHAGTGTCRWDRRARALRAWTVWKSLACRVRALTHWCWLASGEGRQLESGHPRYRKSASAEVFTWRTLRQNIATRIELRSEIFRDIPGCAAVFHDPRHSCRACLARDAAHRHIVATNSAGPDVLAVKCCYFNGLQTYIAGIGRLSGCDPGAVTVIPAKSLSSLDAESRLRDSGAALASAVASSEGIRSCGNPAPVIAIMIVCYLWVIGWWLGPYGRDRVSRRRPTMTGQCLLTPP